MTISDYFLPEMALLLASLAVGAIAGTLGGLLGLGGGVVIVPMLDWLYAKMGFPAGISMHLALGTSLASIVFTYSSSLIAHQRRGSVLWSLSGTIIPWLLLGTLAGSFLAARLSTAPLKAIFAVFLLYMARKMAFPRARAASPKPLSAPLLRLAGAGIGAFSSLVGIGGGSLSVPLLLRAGATMPQAAGTSASMGLPIAVGGAVGYVLNGWGAPGLPEGAVGFVHLPSLLGIAAASVCMAPVGVSLVHRLPTPVIKRIFSLLLLAGAARMICSAL